ncbi:MAG: hypothetical protein JO149_07480 [Gammaproteobacteria bacterium]|nr:hypothetical protein [Gammaproteobacteria bacterium]
MFNKLFTVNEVKDIRQLIVRGSLLIIPFLFLQVVSVFIIPPDWFTFRIWESALSGPYRYPGPFFPNSHIKKEKEYGAGCRYDGTCNYKKTEWFTDSYGWRNRPEIEKRSRYDIVVIGDSNIVGSFLDQKNTLTETLSQRGNLTAYSYANTLLDGLVHFFADSRPVLKTTKLLVVETQPAAWKANNYSLAAFKTLPDGSLDVSDLPSYEKRVGGAVYRDYQKISQFRYLKEKWHTRFITQYLWHDLRANLYIDFFPSKGSGNILGKDPSINHITPIDGNIGTTPLPKDIIVQSDEDWVSEPFMSNKKDGQMVLRFYARNTSTLFPQKFWISDDLHSEPIGEILATTHWQLFEIPINATPGEKITLRINHPKRWQDFLVKDLQIVGAEPFKSASLQDHLANLANKDHSLPFPKPENLTPLEGAEKSLTIYESQYYFYHAMKALARRAKERNMDLIIFLTPDGNIYRVLPAIEQLRKENIKIIAYKPSSDYKDGGVDFGWFWSKGDSHWSERGVRLTTDEIIRMWKTQTVMNRPFSPTIMSEYSNGFPAMKNLFMPSNSQQHA